MEHAQFILGPEVAELESALASRIGARHCITCASGTDALLLALMAVEIGTGDEVITSPFTFIATAEIIALAGAVPVFVDIDPRTYNLDPDLLEAAITQRTRAIMPVSLYGQCASMDAINAVAEFHKLPVIEDAAQSYGATYRGRFSCNLSTIGCTSFFPSKPLGCYGDGGACFTNDGDLARRLQQLRSHGQDRRYHHVRLGLNARFDTLQAAVVLAKLEIFDDEIKQRQCVAAHYSELLRDSVLTPYIEPHNASVWAQYTIQVSDRQHVQDALAKENIPTAIHYPTPVHRQPVFESLNIPAGTFPVSEAAAERVLSLPIHPYLTDEDIQCVADAVRRAVG
jgi:UDP-2-acetamido-2-deoxy-ribo-hexuluronate aminotransferase